MPALATSIAHADAGEPDRMDIKNVFKKSGYHFSKFNAPQLNGNDHTFGVSQTPYSLLRQALSQILQTR